MTYEFSYDYLSVGVSFIAVKGIIFDRSFYANSMKLLLVIPVS